MPWIPSSYFRTSELAPIKCELVTFSGLAALVGETPVMHLHSIINPLTGTGKYCHIE